MIPTLKRILQEGTEERIQHAFMILKALFREEVLIRLAKVRLLLFSQIFICRILSEDCVESLSTKL